MPGPHLLIRTKLFPPYTRAALVQRPRLEALVAQGMRGPLTLVTAPAGFGKTTLVAACIARCSMPVAWLSLDKNDNQLEYFLAYLVSALQQADSASAGQAAFALADSKTPPEAVLTCLVNDLAAYSREMALVLDDYQCISNQAVHAALEFLLDHCPVNFHLVIAARSDPPLPLPRLRARGLVVELRSADLSFTPPETFQFLNEVMGLGLDPGSVAVLEARTEGWITGLQMAALALQAHQAMHRDEGFRDFIEGFSGTNRYILDYLLEEVLAGQTAEIQRFLLYTSPLERLSAPLCSAVLGDPSGVGEQGVGVQSILEYLERANLFLDPLDDSRSWYRYHPLFCDLLRIRLQQVQPGILPMLHRRAAQWYEEHGFAAEAIEHALTGKDWDAAMRLIEQQAMHTLTGQSIRPFIAWLERLPEEQLTTRPWLCVFRAWSMVLACQVSGAERLLQHAADAIQSASSPPESSAVLGNIAMIRAYLGLFDGDMQQVTAQTALADSLLPSDDRIIRCDLKWAQGFPPFLRGDLSAAAQAWAGARDYSLEAGNLYLAVAAMVQLGRLHCHLGRLHAAEDLFQKALDLAVKRGWRRSRLASFVTKDLADVFRERNLLDQADALSREAVEDCERFGNPSDTAMAYAVRSRVLCSQQNMEESRQWLERAWQICDSRAVYPGILDRVVSCQVRWWLVAGDLTAALRWAEESRLSADDSPEFQREARQISLVRVLLALGQVGTAARLLARLEEAAQAGGRSGSRIEILILQALALHAGAHPADAFPALSEALTLAQPEGYVRIYLDEGEPMRRMLSHWLAGVNINSLRDYATYLLSQLAHPAVENLPLPGNLVEPLTERELEVLQLMAQGMTNPEIAHRLVVATGTVKAHAAAIYRKLDAANRTAAVARGRLLGLLR